MPALVVVDADRNFREALAIALRLDGFVVTAAGNADEALERLRRGGVSACVVDVHLPGADAVAEAATRARLRLVLVGPHAELLALAARRYPGAEALAKPVLAAELEARLARREATPGTAG